MALTIDELNIKIQTEADSAERGIDGLSDALSRLKANLNFASQLSAVASGISSISASSKKLNDVDFTNFSKNTTLLSKSLQPLQGFKTQASGLLTSLHGFSETAESFNSFTGFDRLAAQIQTLANALAPLNSVSGKLGATLNALSQITQISNGLGGTNFGVLSTQITNLTNALAPLGNLQSKLGSTLNQLSRLKTVAGELNGVMAGASSSSGIRGFINSLRSASDGSTNAFVKDIQNLVASLKPLETIGKSSLGSIFNQLKKLPEVAQSLSSVDMNSFAAGVQAMSKALDPLVTQLNAVSSGFSALPNKVRAVAKATDTLSSANNRAKKSYGGLLTNITKFIGKASVLVFAFKRIANVFAEWFTESSNYIENLNLFTVTMGDATDAALKYAEAVQDAMGIDISEWIQYQGTFQQLATGFGVASDKATIMSQNLTQLAYDLSSFFNVDVETAFDKLSSGMSGQIKGLKEYGINLSVAALQEYALSRGITQSVRTMSEAQKSILRYNLLMEKTVKIQGDMGRTLVTPANALRILTAQITQLKRALGGIVSVVAAKVIPYVQVFVELLTDAAKRIAGLFGFELPEIDYSGLSSSFVDANEEADNLSGSVSKIKKQLMGFDELNILSSPDSGGGGSASVSGGGSDLGMDLLSYDFLENVKTEKLDEVKQKLKDIFGVIGIIGAGIAGWKLGSFISGLATAGMKATGLKESLALLGKKMTLTLGVTLAVTGIALEGKGIYEAITEGLNTTSFAEILGGGGAIVSGGALIGNFFGSAILGGGIGAIIAGVPMFITGIYDAIKNGIEWLSAALIGVGATATGAGIGAIIGACGGPIGAGIGALIGLAVGALTDLVILIVQKWDGISAWFSTNVIEPVSNFFKGLWEDVSGFFSNLWDDIVAVWDSASDWFDTNVVQPIVDFFAPIVDWISTFFEGCWLIIQAVWITVSNWFNTNVIQPVVNFFKKLKEDVSEFFSQLWADIQSVWNTVSTWFNTNVIQPVVGFFKGVWTSVSGYFSQLWSGIKSVWNKVSEWFNTNVIQPVVNAWRTAINSISGFFSSLWTGIKQGIVSVMNAVIGGIESAINRIVRGINSLIGGFNKVVEWAADVVGTNWGGLSSIREVSLQRISMYEFGGFPTVGEMFIANEAGPELVGRMGSRTAVANTDQIVAGIENGVYNAMSAVMRENGGSDDKHITIRTTVELDNRAVGESVVDYNNGIVKQTGKSPLLV